VIDLCITRSLRNETAVDTGHLLSNKKITAVGLDYITTKKRHNGRTRNRENDDEYRE